MRRRLARTEGVDRTSRLALSIGVFASVVLTAVAPTPAAIAQESPLPRWTEPDGTASWHFHEDFPDEYRDAVRRAAQTWNEADTAFQLVEGPPPEGIPDHCNAIRWVDIAAIAWVKQCPDGPGFLMEFDPDQAWTDGVAVTVPGPDGPVEACVEACGLDVQSVATHEFGHVAGLGHHDFLGAGCAAAAHRWATMCEGGSPLGTAWWRSLEAPDLAGLHALHGS